MIEKQENILSNLPDEAQFNQAAFQQQRINELLLRVDRLSVNPLEFSDIVGLYSYQIIFNDLCSVLLTISAKLTSKEKEKIFLIRDDIKKIINNYPIFRKMTERGWKMKEKTYFRYKIWDTLQNLLFDFRVELEKLMDIHGYGNPTKDINPRTRFGK